MTYIEGFIVAAPIANKDAYVDDATGFAPPIRELGATRMVESWSDDVPEGKVTNFRRSVEAKDDEAVVFSWFEYPDRAARDAANEKMMSDPRMKELGAAMPFDGKRMIYGGFDTIVDERGSGTAATPMASSCRSRRRRRRTTRLWPSVWPASLRGWCGPGARCLGRRRAERRSDRLPVRRAGPGREEVVHSYIQRPDKFTGDAGWAKMMAEDPEQRTPMPFDGKACSGAASAEPRHRGGVGTWPILRAASSGMS